MTKWLLWALLLLAPGSSLIVPLLWLARRIIDDRPRRAASGRGSIP